MEAFWTNHGISAANVDQNPISSHEFESASGAMQLMNVQSKTSPVRHNQGGPLPYPRRSGGMLLPLLAMLMLCALAGCSQESAQVRQAVADYYLGDYPQAEKVLAPLAEKKNQNYVLNNCRYGSAALAAGNLNHAEQAFMRAYRVMNAVNVNTGSHVLGAVILYDGFKVWKGQPFERAMAHYYLGLIFLIKGEYNNARAPFANSLFRLRQYANPNRHVPPAQRYARVESDFTLGYFGLGVCYLHLGNMNLARANFNRAVQLNPALGPIVERLYNPKVNALIFVDYGFGPRRRSKGWYGEQTVFTPAPWQVGPIPPIQAWVNSQPVAGISASAMVNTLALAQDKRWLTMNTIRETKAVVGTGLMAGGLIAANSGARSNNGTVALAGLGAAALGAALAASSHADTRYWQMLPWTVYVLPLTLRQGYNRIEINVAGASVPPFTVNYAGPKYRVLYVRLR